MVVELDPATSLKLSAWLRPNLSQRKQSLRVVVEQRHTLSFKLLSLRFYTRRSTMTQSFEEDTEDDKLAHRLAVLMAWESEIQSPRTQLVPPCGCLFLQ